MLKFLWLIPMLLLLFSGCKKEPESVEPAENEVLENRRIYVLNEGLFNSNNSSLTFYDPDSSIVIQNYFSQKNSRGLGDTGNDIGIYGSKMYIVVNVSSQIEVVDAKTCESVKQIPLFDGGTARQPRNIAFSNGYAFVCSFDGSVAVIDTTSLTTVQFLEAGRNPEDIVVQNNKLYVTNSGGLDAPDYDNTVSVFSTTSFEKISTIEVGDNPGSIAADKYGDVYVSARGSYSEEVSSIYIIDSYNDTVKQILDLGGGVTIHGDSALISQYNYTTGESNIALLNTATEELFTKSFIDGTHFQTLYGVAIDPFTGNIYCTDAGAYVNQGKVMVFDKSGNKIKEFEAGLNPSHFAFYSNNQF